jgi:hypothetical protein
MAWRFVKFYLPKAVSPVYRGGRLYMLKCAFLRSWPDGRFTL